MVIPLHVQGKCTHHSVCQRPNYCSLVAAAAAWIYKHAHATNNAPATLLSDAKNTLQMLSEKSHVGCDLLTQHSCCKDPFSLVIPCREEVHS